MEQDSSNNVKEIVMIAGVQIVTAALTIAFIRWITSPDAVKTLKMSTALKVKKIADAQATSWQNVATKAANAYQKARV